MSGNRFGYEIDIENVPESIKESCILWQKKADYIAKCSKSREQFYKFLKFAKKNFAGLSTESTRIPQEFHNFL